MKTFLVYLTKKLYDGVRKMAYKKHTTMSAVIRKAIEEYLKRGVK